MAQVPQSQAQTEDLRGKVEEIVKNAEELRQELSRLNEVLKVEQLEGALGQLRYISEDLEGWRKKARMNFSLKADESDNVEVWGRASELKWIGYYRLSETPVSKIFDDFFHDTSYVMRAMSLYSEEVRRITDLLIPQLHKIVDEAKEKLSELESRMFDIEREVKKLKNRIEELEEEQDDP
jgi:peptidoglycan hydrolase CwlO-like protein